MQRRGKQLEGIELWKDWINAKGAIYIREVELKYYDVRSGRDEAIRLYEKLISYLHIRVLWHLQQLG